ncbi:HD domain-containing protein [Metallosphaera tengchongensis]|uniref:HD domain-containing protein n=1 Tax=Metallosphaera tengchongensis TaxID=1532350 RepID=A0A6N0P095_9CREN|nr:HD domain-containing protein [Metallosphaera tengchongensis]QKR00771.1 HD domain-containing protein [Metallosphaera tengchongensis]
MTIRGKLNLPDFKITVEDAEDKGEKLKPLIVNVLKKLVDVSCELVQKQSNVSDRGRVAMDIFADLVSVLYKLPVLTPYAQVSRKSEVITTVYESFLAYVVSRHLDLKFDSLELEEVMKKLEGNNIKELVSKLREVMSGREVRSLYEALLNTPADTRPGYNFTSLASHLQLTSLLTWLLQTNSVDLNYLRVSSLLHDVGKLVSPRHHVKASIEILDEVLKEESCLKDQLEHVKSLVSTHHRDYDTIIRSADGLASSADRLSQLVEHYMREQGNQLKVSECYSLKREESFDCFDKHGKEEYEKASKTVYKYLVSQILKDSKALHEGDAKFFDYLRLEDLPKVPEPVLKKVVPGNLKGYLVYVDFPGVQKFITSFPKMREMSFASMLVDFVTSVYSFILLDQKLYSGKTRLPVEALISGYGGHSYIVVRKDEGVDKDKVEQALSQVIQPLDVRLHVAVVDFAYDNYVRNFQEIWEDILSQSPRRYLINWEEEELSLGLHLVCDYCGVRPVVHEIKERDQTIRLCSRCNTVREWSKNRGFMARAGARYVLGDMAIFPGEQAEEIFGEDYPSYAMEFIAGYKSPQDGKYVSLVKADGNRASTIFMTSVTLSDYVERSFRLDYGIKKAFQETVADLAKESEDLAGRVLSGVLYLGGDDLMLMMPSAVSVPFALAMFKRAEEYTGFTFKVGIVTVKPDHPVQFAYQAVNELMEKAKIKESNESSIAFLVFSTTLATAGVVLAEVERFSKDKFLQVSNSLKKVEEVLKVYQLDTFEKAVEMYNQPNKKGKKARDYLRPFEDLAVYSQVKPDYYDVVAYALRTMVRTDDPDDREVLKMLLKDVGRGGQFPILDYYFALKNFRVGTQGGQRD